MNIVLQPLIQMHLLGVLGLAGLILAAIGFYVRAPGALWRAGGIILILGGLANPVLVRENREALADVVVIIDDQSPSQALDGRAQQSLDAADALLGRLAQYRNLEVRHAAPTGSGDSTRLFETVQNLLLDTPPDRVAGIILLTDGQVHDAPKAELPLRLSAPVHVLLTGDPARPDRQLIVEQAPKFGIVGESLPLIVRFEDKAAQTPEPQSALLTLRINGGPPIQREISAGENHRLDLRLEHAGPNIVELEIAAREGELSPRNNRMALSVNGVRDRLRVLLVSGEPNPGERTWRNLLKADPSVDLVHFTILRPPEKQDGTPVEELALISFPTRELFTDRLDEFDLVIFDRYQQRGVLNFTHFDNIAKYVENGGALLAVSGPDLIAPDSLYRTALAAIFPAQPTGRIQTGAFTPLVTDVGFRHPVTEELPGANKIFAIDAKADWGRWFRVVETERLAGHTLMAAPSGAPLLILDKIGDGRVAQILSDHGWLWARGYEGGGPQAELLRRLAHWLMKEPGLEEENLRADASDTKITITRRSLAPGNAPIEVTLPNGLSRPLSLQEIHPGRWQAVMDAEESGIYRFRDGARTALAAVGQNNYLEYGDMQSSAEILAPLAQATRGGVYWLGKEGLPDVRRVKPDRDLAGKNWLGLRENSHYRVISEAQHPLFPPLLLMALVAGMLGMAWRAEGR